MFIIVDWLFIVTAAELAQSVERTTLNRVVEGSIPSFGDGIFGLPFASLDLSPDHGLSFGPI